MTDASSSTCIDASGDSGISGRSRGRGRRLSFGDANTNSSRARRSSAAADRDHDGHDDDCDENGGSLSASSSSFSSISSTSSASDRRTGGRGAASAAASPIGRRRTSRLAERAPTLLPRNQATSFGPNGALFPLNTGARPAARTLPQATESSYNNGKEDELLLPTSALASQLGRNICQSLRSISVHHGNATCNDMISGKMSDAAEAGGSPDSSTSSLSSGDAYACGSSSSGSFYSPGLSSLTRASSSSSSSSCPSSPSELSASSSSSVNGSPPCRHKSRLLIRPGSLHNKMMMTKKKDGISARGGRGRYRQLDGDTSGSDDSISSLGGGGGTSMSSVSARSDQHPHRHRRHPYPRYHQYGGYGHQEENVHHGNNGTDPLCRVTEDGGASSSATATAQASSCAATKSIVSSLAPAGTSLAAPTTTRNNKGPRRPIGPHAYNGSILTKPSSDGATHSGASTVFTDFTSTDISEAAFSYYYKSIGGYMRDVISGFGHRLYCKVTRRPSYTKVVGPTQCLNCRSSNDGDPLWDGEYMPMRVRLGHNIRYGMDVVSTTALHQWQHHWRMLMLVGIMMVALGMLSYAPTYDGADGPTSPSMSSSSTSSGDDMTSSAGYERDLHQKLGLLGLIDPNSPQYRAATPQETQDEGDMHPEDDAIAATNVIPASYYSIPKKYQILMPSSFGSGSTLGASPVTNIVRLGPLKDVAYVTEEIRPNDVPFFFHIPRSAGCTLKHIIGQCLGMVISSHYGAKFGHEQDEALMVVTADHGGQYVNADTSTPHGIERAKAMGLVESNMADVVVTQLLYNAATMFNPNQRGRLFTIFRDPIERAVSMYYYLGDAEWEPTYDPVLKQIPLADYARSSRIEHNWMTRILSDTPVGPLDANHLELAKAVIRQKTLVGLLSRKSETVERFKVAFNWQSNFPEFENSVSSSAEKRNLELSQAEECQDKLVHIDWPNKHVHPRLDDENTEVYSLLYEVNRFDMELYRYAERIFDEQSVLFLPGGVYYREG